MEDELPLSGKTSDAGSTTGCNYQPDDVDDAPVSIDMIQHQQQHHANHHHHLLHHHFQTDQTRVLQAPPHYDSLTPLNNNNISSISHNNNNYNGGTADHVDNGSKYHQLTAHLLGHTQPSHHHGRWYDNLHHSHHQLQHQQQQQLVQYQLDYCNSLQSYGGMTSSSSVSPAVSGAGAAVSSRSSSAYCGQFEPGAGAYSAGEPRSHAGYWTPSCGVATDQHSASADPDTDPDPADVKPTLLDPSSSYIGHYPARHQGYLPAGWYGYGWGDVTGGYYTASSGYSEIAAQSATPPMHHILRGVYNTLQVSGTCAR